MHSYLGFRKGGIKTDGGSDVHFRVIATTHFANSNNGGNL